MLLASADVASLDALLSWWEVVEYVAEAAVILGCAGEFVAEFTQVRTPAWRHQFSRASLLILIVGLAVELGALVRTNSLSGREIALLNETARGFDARIAEAQRGTAEANRDAKAASEQAAEAELETAQLYALTAPRRLTPDQQRRIRDALKPFARRSIRLETYGLDGEGMVLGTQIMDALKAVPIIVGDFRSSFLQTGGFDFGIQVRGPRSENDFVPALTDALRNIGKLDA